MKRKMILVGALLCAALSTQAATVDFEAPTYSVGNVNGQDGWSVSVGTANVTANGNLAGAQELGVDASSAAYRNFAGINFSGKTMLKFRAGRFAVMTGYLRLGTSDNTSDAIIRINFNYNSGIGVYSSGGFEGYVLNEFDANDVYEITVEMDFSAQTYDITVDNLTDGISGSQTGVGFEHSKSLSDFTSSGGVVRIDSSFQTLFADNISIYPTPGYLPTFYVDVNSIGGPADDNNAGTIDHPFATVQAAVSAAGRSATILLRGGVYKETIAIGTDKGGTAEFPLVIKAYSNELAVIDGQNQRTWGILLQGTEADLLSGVPPAPVPSGDYVRIENLRLVNFNRSGLFSYYALGVINRTGVVIDHVVVDNADFGIYIANSEDVELTNSEIHHCYPVRVRAPSRNIRIHNNYVHHGTGTKSYAINHFGPASAAVDQSAVTSVVDVGGGVAECTVSIDASAINMSGRDLQGEPDASGFYPHCLLVYTNAPVFASRQPPATGVIPGGQKLLENGMTGFRLVNNSAWGGKPYSPDGSKVRIMADSAAMANLQSASYGYFINTWNPDIQISYDIVVTSNTVHDSNCQGMQFSNVRNLFIEGNTLYANGASGIQIEDGCRNVWIENNISYNNSVIGNGECGIWTALNRDVVVQNNIMYGSQSGFKISSCQRTLVRRNLIFDNRAQYAMTVTNGWFTHTPVGYDRVKLAAHVSAGLVVQGGGHAGVGAPPEVDECAFVHNTLYDNGVGNSMYHYGSLMCGNPNYPVIGGDNIFLNNIVSSRYNENLFAIFHAEAFRVDGNLYNGPSNAQMEYYPGGPAGYNPENIQYFSINTQGGFESYKAAMGLDAHSVYGDPAFTDPAQQDFSLQSGSKAIDIGVPLSYTASAGSGTVVPVTSTWAFTAGYRTGTGEQLVAGDVIQLGAQIVQIVEIDRDASTLEISPSASWTANAPIRYEFSGTAPDAGAIEYGSGN